MLDAGALYFWVVGRKALVCAGIQCCSGDEARDVRGPLLRASGIADRVAGT